MTLQHNASHFRKTFEREIFVPKRVRNGFETSKDENEEKIRVAFWLPTRRSKISFLVREIREIRKGFRNFIKLRPYLQNNHY